MIILAFDSTAKAASVAITDDCKLLALYNVDNGLTQSELLLPMAESMLNSLHLTIDDVELLACAVGPGSFTGVRIGATLVKGLAFGKNIPCASVSTLDELAENMVGIAGIVTPVMDARRGQVYTAIYRSYGDHIEKLTDDMAIPITELGEMLGKYKGEPIYLTGDGYNTARGVLTDMGIAIQSTPPLNISESAYSVARVAKRLYDEGKAVSDREISPTYLRMPQAERERLERLAAQEK